MSTEKNKKSTNTIIVNKDNLPLSCPREDYLKLSHPKIFLPIEKEKSKTIKCPYCSTIYQLDGNNEF